jgi:multidrug efflux pump subunit AcrA (membrane-fusion protein)
MVGKVAVVGPAVNVADNAVTLAVDVPPDSHLRPGQTIRVRVVVDTHADCLTVPREAVVTDENGDSVISLVEGSQATHKAVKVGYEEQGQVEIITDDVKEGATVVTAGVFGLPAATRVKVLD